jgi:GTP-binding protein
MDSITFIKSAVYPHDYPMAKQPEVAVVGRSNAGKSSLLNALAKKKIAFVSQKPGKTALINFFQFGQIGILVDLPGYGFAKRSKTEIKAWRSMIEGYLTTRESLRGILLVMDISRDIESDEHLILDFANYQRVPVALVFTKIDKLGQNEWRNRAKKLMHQAPVSQCFVVSNKTGFGISELYYFLKFEWFKKGKR